MTERSCFTKTVDGFKSLTIWQGPESTLNRAWFRHIVYGIQTQCPFWYFVPFSHFKDFNTHRWKDGTNSYFPLLKWLAPLEMSKNYASLGNIIFSKVGGRLLTTKNFFPDLEFFLGVFQNLKSGCLWSVFLPKRFIEFSDSLI